MMRRKRNQEQSKVLVEFMQKHKNIATSNVLKSERTSVDELWRTLTYELNSKGPPIKECSEWKSAWAEWKKACRRKFALAGKGNHSFTEYEQIIIDTCGIPVKTLKEYDSDEFDFEERASRGSSYFSDTLQTSAATHDQDPPNQENIDTMEADQNDKILFKNDNLSFQQRGQRRNQEQSKALIEFMQKHRNIATGHIGKYERESAKLLWRKLTEELNSKGPPVKDCSAWKSAWAEWKKSCRKKLARPKNGGRDISEYEQIIIEICGLTTFSIEEYESERSRESSISSDNPLKATVAVYKDISYKEASTSETNDNICGLNSYLKTGRRRTLKQSAVLLNFMQTHKNIAIGLARCDDEEVRKLWHKLADELNGYGPPKKSLKGWKIAWKDWKIACQRKLNCNLNLSSQEQSIIKLCDIKPQVQIEYNSDDGLDSSSDVLNQKRSLSPNTDEDNILKKLKLDEEENSNDFHDESIEISCTSESPPELNMGRTPTPSLLNIERTLADVRDGVTSMQASLQELCRLMSEQNHEIRRFISDSRHHHFDTEKNMIEKKT